METVKSLILVAALWLGLLWVVLAPFAFIGGKGDDRELRQAVWVGLGVVVALAAIGFAIPLEDWKNEWSSSGECLAWRVREFGGGLVTQELRGPFVVEKRWCRQ